MAILLRCAALATGGVSIIIFLFLLKESAPLLWRVGLGAFVRNVPWAPTSGTYGVLPMVVGTFWAMLGSVLVATPLGVAAAVFTTFYAPRWLGTIVRTVLWLLAGIPSVVYGFWGLVTLVPIINRIHAPGVSLLAGISILTIMILPTIALMAEAALETVPRSYIQAAHALGAGTWGIVRSVVIPAARSGLFAGVILEMGRAIGETMAVIMVMGNTVQYPSTWFDSARTLTANIALEMAYATGDHQRALFVTGLALLGIITLMIYAADRLEHSFEMDIQS
jgi:phosphate transport system permease protein